MPFWCSEMWCDRLVFLLQAKIPFLKNVLVFMIIYYCDYFYYNFLWLFHFLLCKALWIPTVYEMCYINKLASPCLYIQMNQTGISVYLNTQPCIWIKSPIPLTCLLQAGASSMWASCCGLLNEVMGTGAVRTQQPGFGAGAGPFRFAPSAGYSTYPPSSTTSGSVGLACKACGLAFSVFRRKVGRLGFVEYDFGLLLIVKVERWHKWQGKDSGLHSGSTQCVSLD